MNFFVVVLIYLLLSLSITYKFQPTQWLSDAVYTKNIVRCMLNYNCYVNKIEEFR